MRAPIAVLLIACLSLPAVVYASNADKPPKGSKEPKKGCGSGCAGTPPDCKCPARSERKAMGPRAV